MCAQELVELIAAELGGGCRAQADAVRVVAALRVAGYLGMTEPRHVAGKCDAGHARGAMPFAG